MRHRGRDVRDGAEPKQGPRDRVLCAFEGATAREDAAELVLEGEGEDADEGDGDEFDDDLAGPDLVP